MDELSLQLEELGKSFRERLTELQDKANLQQQVLDAIWKNCELSNQTPTDLNLVVRSVELALDRTGGPTLAQLRELFRNELKGKNQSAPNVSEVNRALLEGSLFLTQSGLPANTPIPTPERSGGIRINQKYRYIGGSERFRDRILTVKDLSNGHIDGEYYPTFTDYRPRPWDIIMFPTMWELASIQRGQVYRYVGSEELFKNHTLTITESDNQWTRGSYTPPIPNRSGIWETESFHTSWRLHTANSWGPTGDGDWVTVTEYNQFQVGDWQRLPRHPETIWKIIGFDGCAWAIRQNDTSKTRVYIPSEKWVPRRNG